MEEREITAETTETVTSEQVVVEETSVAEDVNKANVTQEQSDANVDNNVVETPKVEQTKEENAEFARQRREKELQAKLDKAKEETRIQTIIDVVGINPYTQEPLTNELDVRIYEEMKAYEKNGGDPVSDQAKIIKGIILKDNQSKQDAINQEKAQQESNNKAKSEINELQSAYPELDIRELLNDDRFKDYADGKLGAKTLKQVYDGFVKFTTPKQAETPKVDAQVRETANQNASVGSLKGEASIPTGLLTPEQVRNMSRAEISAKYDLVMKSMASWK